MLQPGDAMPHLHATNDRAEEIGLADFLGNPLVLWFYPKDDTPG